MSASKPKAKLLALILVIGAAVTALIMGVSRSSSGRALGATSVDKPVSRSESVLRDRVFISGSMVNLREAASKTATLVSQVPIGTECIVEERANSGWWRIGCGDIKGWAKTELLSTERPTLEPHLTLAQDSKQPLKDRFDAALRATALAPEHAAAREILWSLFAEQEWVQTENLLTQEPSRLPLAHFAVACDDGSSTVACLNGAVSPHVTSWFVDYKASWDLLETRDSERLGGSMFVSVALMRSFIDSKKPPELLVRTGTFKGDSKALDVQVFAQSRYVPSDTLKSALEKLPKTHQTAGREINARFTPEQLEALRRLEGNWTKLERTAQGLVTGHSCGHPLAVHLAMHEDHAQVELDLAQDSIHFDVWGVQLAKDGSITLMASNGETLKYALVPEDKRVARWTFPGKDDFKGLFVHSDQEKAFPVDPPKDCDDVY